MVRSPPFVLTLGPTLSKGTDLILASINDNMMSGRSKKIGHKEKKSGDIKDRSKIYHG